MAEPHYEDERVTLHHAECLDVLRTLPDCSVDSVVTDPPYGIGFLGAAWDDLPPGREWAEECLRVLKPGGHLVAFGGTRTWHRLAAAVEDAGFEIRDSIAWLFGSGLPKSKNLTDDWDGWGSALKPGFEPIVVGRRPFKGTLSANVAKVGTGAINVAGCRFKSSEGDQSGRWPTNVALDPEAQRLLDETPGRSTLGTGVIVKRQGGAGYSGGWKNYTTDYAYDRKDDRISRYFPIFRFCSRAKWSGRPTVTLPDGSQVSHPTTKPLDLMRWLVRLVTPPGGLVLEPFAGSGTTIEACLLEGMRCIGIEREAEYLPLIMQRIDRSAQGNLFLGEEPA